MKQLFLLKFPIGQFQTIPIDAIVYASGAGSIDTKGDGKPPESGTPIANTATVVGSPGDTIPIATHYFYLMGLAPQLLHDMFTAGYSMSNPKEAAPILCKREEALEGQTAMQALLALMRSIRSSMNMP